MCATYFLLFALLPRFFAQKITTPLGNPFLSILYIVLFSILAYGTSLSIQDLELSNRILHILGGGFFGFLTCFFATRDSGVRINKFQFFVLSALIVLALGVANELLEFLLQSYAGIISAATPTDTWFDLASNTIGIGIASIFLVQLHK